MNRWSKGTIAAAAVLLGLALGNQARTGLMIRAHLSVLPQDVLEFGHRLARAEQRKEALEKQVYQLRLEIAALEQAAAARHPRLVALGKQLNDLKNLAGVVRLEGPGLILELRDSNAPLLPGQDPNEFILHNYQIAILINDLWAAGAEALAVNGERIVATTPIRSVATTFMINTKRVTPPLEIVAIGDPDRLARHISRPGGALEFLQAMDFPARVRRADRVTVPAYKGAFLFRYARASEARP